MPTYQISYTRSDMPRVVCKAIKTAHTEEQALGHLTTGSKTKGLRLKKAGVLINLKEIKEI